RAFPAGHYQSHFRAAMVRTFALSVCWVMLKALVSMRFSAKKRRVHILASLDAGQGDGLATRIVGCAAVIGSGRIIEPETRALYLKQPEENSHTGCADQPG